MTEKIGLKVGYSKTINLGNYENEKFEFAVEFSADADRESYPQIMLDELVKLRLLCKGKAAGSEKKPKEEVKKEEPRAEAKEGRETTKTKSTPSEEIKSPEDEQDKVDRDKLLTEATALGIENPKKLGTTALIKRINKFKKKAATKTEEVVKEPIEDLPTKEEVRAAMGQYVISGSLTKVEAKQIILKYGEAEKLADVPKTKYRAIMKGAESLIAEKDEEI